MYFQDVLESCMEPCVKICIETYTPSTPHLHPYIDNLLQKHMCI